MIGYHWSPARHRESIRKRGLLVPAKHPDRVTATTCSEGHLNPHISLGRNPKDAWRLSGAFVKGREGIPPTEWDLWQVDLTGLSYRPLHRGSDELTTRIDIPKSHLALVAHKHI